MRLRLAPALVLAGLVAAAATPAVLAQSSAKNPSPGKGAPAAAAPAAPTVAATTAPGAPITAERMAAHRAAYRLTLDRTRDNAQIAGARSRVILDVGQLHGPHAVFAALNMRYGLPLVAAPRSEGIAPRSITRHKRPARSLRRVEPIRAGMVEDDVEDDAQSRCMRAGD